MGSELGVALFGVRGRAAGVGHVICEAAAGTVANSVIGTSMSSCSTQSWTMSARSMEFAPNSFSRSAVREPGSLDARDGREHEAVQQWNRWPTKRGCNGV